MFLSAIARSTEDGSARGNNCAPSDRLQVQRSAKVDADRAAEWCVVRRTRGVAEQIGAEFDSLCWGFPPTQMTPGAGLPAGIGAVAPRVQHSRVLGS